MTEQEHTVCVTGRGAVRVLPDTVRLTLTVRAQNKDYAQAVQEAETGAERLKAALGQGGAEKVGAAGARVEPYYETKEAEGRTQRRQAGYIAARRIRSELPADPARLARVLEAVAACGVQPELSLEYALADGEAVQLQAASLAVENAKKRAQALAEAAGVKLLALLTLESGGAARPFAVRAAVLRADGAEGIAPEEITVEEEVRMVFKIA